MNEGVAFGICVAAVFLFIFAVELMRGKMLSEIRANAATWGIFLILTAAGHIHTPDDPSILITVGAAMQLLAFCILLAPREGKPGPRMPLEFGILMCAALTLRVIVTMQFDGYLPNDETGDGCIQALEALTCAALLYGMKKEITLRGAPGKVFLRSSMAITFCVIIGLICFGNLDKNSTNGNRADEEYASTIYMELLAWGFMFVFMREKREAVNLSFLRPSAIQGFSRAFYWYAALPETTVSDGIRLQHVFGWILVLCHVAMGLICAALATASDVRAPHFEDADHCFV